MSHGTREERAYYCQNWRGDVVTMLKATGSTNCSVMETVRYSSYGVPFGITPGDVDGDGDVDSDDADAVLDWQTNGPYTVRADFDLDGAIDGDDFATAFANSGRSLGRGVLSHSSVANRKGYCGYEHDGVIDTLAHVRHRVLLTELGRWSRRDPLEGRHFDAAEPTSLRRVRLQTIVTERRFSLRGVACR